MLQKTAKVSKLQPAQNMPKVPHVQADTLQTGQADEDQINQGNLSNAKINQPGTRVPYVNKVGRPNMKKPSMSTRMNKLIGGK